MDKLKNTFQTLADTSRLRIIHAIGDHEKSVGEIVKTTGLSQPLVSHHLRVLKENFILSTSRKGPFIYYFARDLEILYAINLFITIFKDTTSDEEQLESFCPDWIIKKYNYKQEEK
jgi:DNA-binding transcriptional ArsR family regulator